MDTQINIDTLQSILSTTQANIAGLSAQAEALTIAINQLKGILVTQATELQNKYQTTISDLENSKANLEATVAEKQAEIDELKTATAIIPPEEII